MGVLLSATAVASSSDSRSIRVMDASTAWVLPCSISLSAEVGLRLFTNELPSTSSSKSILTPALIARTACSRLKPPSTMPAMSGDFFSSADCRANLYPARKATASFLSMGG